MEATTSRDDKRADPRSPIHATQVRMGTEWEYFYGYARNVSRSGLLVYTVRELKVGDEFKIEFTLPDTDITVRCAAKVMWERSYHQAENHSPRMGVRFSDIDPRTADSIDRWVTSRLNPHGNETSH